MSTARSPQDALPCLRIGRQSAGFIARGHPWLRPDRFTGPHHHLHTGQAVTLVDERGRPLASAVFDATATVMARVFDRRPHRPFQPEAAVAAAWQGRAALHKDSTTDCYRLIHGEADGLPGLVVERYAGVLVATWRSPASLVWKTRITQALRRHWDAVIVHREHLDDLRRQPPRLTIDGQAPADPDWTIDGRELGVTCRIQPAAALATGLYIDQRGTRQWLRTRCQGARVLNLFAYSGVFSISLLCAGAAQAVDVDIAAPALALASTNARRNDVADRHRTVRQDCLGFVRSLPAETRFDCIICDPPTAARGRQGWGAARDCPPQITALLPHLSPGGHLLLTSNQLGRQHDPARLLAAHPALAVEQPGPQLATDIPQLAGFPEGRPFRIAAAQRLEG